MSAYTLHLHDDTLPANDARVVDDGLGDANLAAAPLHEVRALGCFAHDDAGRVIGGAVGRSWGECCELQQLWVQPERRGGGLGTALVRAFEARAVARGCRLFYLETFSFQAPEFYQRLGYETVHAGTQFPHGIVKHLMQRRV